MTLIKQTLTKINQLKEDLTYQVEVLEALTRNDNLVNNVVILTFNKAVSYLEKVTEQIDNKDITGYKQILYDLCSNTLNTDDSINKITLSWQHNRVDECYLNYSSYSLNGVAVSKRIDETNILEFLKQQSSNQI